MKASGKFFLSRNFVGFGLCDFTQVDDFLVVFIILNKSFFDFKVFINICDLYHLR